MTRCYAYENWTARAHSAHDVMVHRDGSAHCPFGSEGRRHGPQPSGSNDQWHPLGELGSEEAPMRTVRAIVPSHIVFRYCGDCLRDAVDGMLSVPSGLSFNDSSTSSRYTLSRRWIPPPHPPGSILVRGWTRPPVDTRFVHVAPFSVCVPRTASPRSKSQTIWS